MIGLYTPLRTPSLKDPRKNPKPFTTVQSPWIQGIGVECVGFGGGVYGFTCRLNGSEIPEPVWGGQYFNIKTDQSFTARFLWTWA